jgi:phosphatidylinositol glycan class N
MVYTAIFVLRTYIISPSPRDHVRFGSIFGAVVFAATSLYFYLEHSPVTYYLYTLFPTYFWGQIIDDIDTIQDLVDWASNRPSSSPTRIWTTIVVTVMCLEFMVLGYFHRVAWTIGWLVIGVLWPFLALSSTFKEENATLIRAWSIASVFTSAFTVLPVEKGESLPVMLVWER